MEGLQFIGGMKEFGLYGMVLILFVLMFYQVVRYLIKSLERRENIAAETHRKIWGMAEAQEGLIRAETEKILSQVRESEQNIIYNYEKNSGGGGAQAAPAILKRKGR